MRWKKAVRTGELSTHLVHLRRDGARRRAPRARRSRARRCPTSAFERRSGSWLSIPPHADTADLERACPVLEEGERFELEAGATAASNGRASEDAQRSERKSLCPPRWRGHRRGPAHLDLRGPEGQRANSRIPPAHGYLYLSLIGDRVPARDADRLPRRGYGLARTPCPVWGCCSEGQSGPHHELSEPLGQQRCGRAGSLRGAPDPQAARGVARLHQYARHRLDPGAAGDG